MRNAEFRIGFAMTEYKVGETQCARPKLIINNKKIFTHRVGRGLAPAEKLSVLNIEFGGLWASRPTMDL